MNTKKSKGSVKIKLHGELTAKIGKSLKLEGYDVFYDHGTTGANVGRIVSYIGAKNKRSIPLSNLDIAIVKKDTKKAVALVEIEEKTDRPKSFLGDVFGVLMGEKIRFQGEPLAVGIETTLIVVGVSKAPHKERNGYILDKVEKVRPTLGTNNSAIGKVFIETFPSERKLATFLRSELARIVSFQ